jgi:hypothetical protein
MKATLQGLAFVCLFAAISPTAQAQLPCPSCSKQAIQYLPNSYMPDPNAYAPNYGPSYYQEPYASSYGYMPPRPFGGVPPPANPFAAGGCGRGGAGGGGGCGNGIMAFPMHQYARSPRDFFMMDIECCGTHP